MTAPTASSAAKKGNAPKGMSNETGARRTRKDPPRTGRASKSLGALQRRAELGEDVSDERAYIRLGKTNTQILVGNEDLREWDEEELLRGQRKAVDGTFVGRPPKVVPKAIHDELVRRTMTQAAEELRSNLVKAVESLTGIAADAEANDSDRLKAIDMIMTRVMGKPPERVEVTADMPWLAAITGGIVSVDEDVIEDIVDAQSWETLEEEDGGQE